MKNLLSDYDYIEKVKITYKNLVELLDFLNKIYYKEISNQRFSYILYINIFILHNGLTKFKSYIKPTLDKGFKSEKNYVINDDNTYTLNKFLQCNIKVLQDIDLKDNLCEKNFLFQNNIFLFQSEKRIKLKTYNPYLKLLRNNKLEEIDLNKFDGNSVIYSIMPKQNKNIISDNKIEINEKTTILNPFVKTFDDNNNVKIENLYYSNLTYNDNNINQKIKENNFLFDGVKENEYNLFDFKNKCIILHNGYILIFLNTYNFHSYNRNLSEEEIIFYLILINNKNEVKNILTTYSNGIIYHIYKNIFMISHKGYMYFYTLFEKSDRIELLSKIVQNFIINESFEFNDKCCIFYSQFYLMFYNWTKNEIIRKININKEYINSQLLLINKYTFFGYSPILKIIFAISLIDNKYYIFEGTIIAKHFIHLYNNFFIIIDNNGYNVINILQCKVYNSNNINTLINKNNNEEKRLFSQDEQNNFFNKKGLFY